MEVQAKTMSQRVIIEFAVGRPSDWLREKLDGFVWVLNQNLRNNQLGWAERQDEVGVMRVRAFGISLMKRNPWLMPLPKACATTEKS